MLFLVIDTYSKWLEIFLIPTTTFNKTTETLKSLLARYGLLEQIVLNNGPLFTSDYFKWFCKSNGIRYITSAPYNPSTNGVIEQAM